MPKDVFVRWPSRVAPSFGCHLPLPFEVFYLNPWVVYMLDGSPVVYSHYVLCYCDHFHCHSICDFCMLQGNSHHYNSYPSSHSVGQTASGQHDVVRPQQLIPMNTVMGLQIHHYPTAKTTWVPDAFSGICQLCHGTSTSKFLFQSLASKPFPYHVLVSVTVFTLCFQVAR